jgi:hypothetical protein
MKRVFAAEYVELESLEALIMGIAGLTDDRRNRLLIVCSEIFDNILTHSDRLLARRVLFSLETGPAIQAAFKFKAPNFRAFAKGGEKRVQVRFDEKTGRHRGLGLTMCSNLAASIRFKPGCLLDSVEITI